MSAPAGVERRSTPPQARQPDVATRPGPAAAVALVATGGYLLLTAVLLLTDVLRTVDAAGARAGAELRAAHAGSPVLYLAELGSAQVVAGAALAVAGTAAVALRRWRPLLASAVTLVLLAAAVEGSKALVGRGSPTPDGVRSEAFFLPGGAAFPSGHTAGALVVTYLVGSLLVGPGGVAAHRALDRWLPVAAGVVAVGVGGLTVTRGWHWPSDVAGGLLLGVVVCAAGRGLLAGRDGRGGDGRGGDGRGGDLRGGDPRGGDAGDLRRSRARRPPAR